LGVTVLFRKLDRGDISEPRTHRFRRSPARHSGWPVIIVAKTVRFDPALRTAAELCEALRAESTQGNDQL